MAMTRKELLDKAYSIVNGARDKSYGSPEDSFKCIGQMWNAYLGRRLMKKLSPSDVAAMMGLLKIARISSGMPPMSAPKTGVPYIWLSMTEKGQFSYHSEG